MRRNFEEAAWAALRGIGNRLERFPITWTHMIEKESLRFKELEHVKLEKAGQFFRDML